MTALEFLPGVFLDCNRALWLREERTLVVADVHLGYSWARRHSGQLFPVNVPDDTVERLSALQQKYQAETTIFLGDIVHRALDLPWLDAQLARLASTLSASSRLRFVIGNHDRGLEGALRRNQIEVQLEEEIILGKYRLLHGDKLSEKTDHSSFREERGQLTLVGHEHPAIYLDDGVTTNVKCPCFAIGPKLLILPAFSNWAAGTNISQLHPQYFRPSWLELRQAVVIIGQRLLAIPPHLFPRP